MGTGCPCQALFWLAGGQLSLIEMRANLFTEDCHEVDSGVVFSHPICYPQTMRITVQLPDDLIQHPNPGREALEALAIEGYRVGTLSHYQASQLLGLSRFEFDGFLKGRHIYDHAYDLEDLEEDRETLQQLQAEGLLRR